MRLKTAIFAAVLSAGVLLGNGPVYAFQETGPHTNPSAAKALPAPDLGFDVEKKHGTNSERRKKSGFRTLDVLPKTLDFGLELLYGSPTPQDSTGHSLDDLLTDEMTIRGTIKRRF